MGKQLRMRPGRTSPTTRGQVMHDVGLKSDLQDRRARGLRGFVIRAPGHVGLRHVCLHRPTPALRAADPHQRGISSPLPCSSWSTRPTTWRADAAGRQAGDARGHRGAGRWSGATTSRCSSTPGPTAPTSSPTPSSSRSPLDVRGDFGRADDGPDIATESRPAWGLAWPSRCRPSCSGCSSRCRWRCCWCSSGRAI